MENYFDDDSIVLLESMQDGILYSYILLKTTYRVWAHFSTTSTETMEDKIKRLLREEVRQAMENE